MQGLGERPAMSGGVADGALTLSVRKILWLADDLAPRVVANAIALHRAAGDERRSQTRVSVVRGGNRAIAPAMTSGCGCGLCGSYGE
jgi:hypothetical protein